MEQNTKKIYKVDTCPVKITSVWATKTTPKYVYLASLAKYGYPSTVAGVPRVSVYTTYFDDFISAKEYYVAEKEKEVAVQIKRLNKEIAKLEVERRCAEELVADDCKEYDLLDK